jgi:hypothetical protein
MDSEQKRPHHQRLRRRHKWEPKLKCGRAQTKLGKPGRPKGTFKDVDTAKLTADIASGVPVAIACAAVGLSQSSFNSWLDERPEFAQALAAEKQRVISETLGVIKSCTTKDRQFRQACWFLETVYRDYFAPPAQPGVNLTQNNIMLGDLEEARRILDAAKALPYRSQSHNGEIQVNH